LTLMCSGSVRSICISQKIFLFRNTCSTHFRWWRREKQCPKCRMMFPRRSKVQQPMIFLLGIGKKGEEAFEAKKHCWHWIDRENKLMCSQVLNSNKNKNKNKNKKQKTKNTKNIKLLHNIVQQYCTILQYGGAILLRNIAQYSFINFLIIAQYCTILLRNIAQYCAILCNIVQYCAIFFLIIAQYCTILQLEYCAILCNIVQYYCLQYCTIGQNIAQYYCQYYSQDCCEFGNNCAIQLRNTIAQYCTPDFLQGCIDLLFVW
jgi:hypothetical protein